MSSSGIPACTNCCQPYSIRSAAGPKARTPHMLRCGHTFCDKCLLQLAKAKRSEIVVCPECRHHTPLVSGDGIASLDVDVYIYGQLLLKRRSKFTELRRLLGQLDDTSLSVLAPPDTPNSPDRDLPQCCECSTATAAGLCNSCGAEFCNPCFKKVHRHSKVLQKHTLTPLESGVQMFFKCSEHLDRHVEFYCRPCKQPVCAHCLSATWGGQHAGHAVTGIEMHKNMLFQDLASRESNVYSLTSSFMSQDKELDEALSMLKTECFVTMSAVQKYFQQVHSLLQHRENVAIAKLHDKAALLVDNLVQAKKELKQRISDCNQSVRWMQRAEKGDLAAVLRALQLTKILTEDKATPSLQISPSVDTIRFDPSDDLLSVANSFSCIGGGQQLRCNHVTAKSPTVECELSGKASNFMEQVLSTATNAPPVYVPENVVEPESRASPLSQRNVQPEAAFQSTPPAVNLRSQDGGKHASAVDYSRLQLDMSSAQSGHGNKEMEVPVRDSSGSLFCEDVTVVHTISPYRFTVQRVSDTHQADRIGDELHAYSRSPSAVPVASVVTDSLVCAQFTDGEWYRGRVRAVRGSGTYSDDIPSPPPGCNAYVEYIDFGNSHWIASRKLLQLPPQFAKVAPLALVCCIANVKPAQPSESGGWPEQAISSFENMISEETFLMKVLRRCGTVCHVDLIKKSSSASVRSALLEQGLALDVQLSPTGTVIPKATLLPNTTNDVLVSYVNDSGSFYVQQLGEPEDELLALMEDLRVYYNNPAHHSPLDSVELGSICCAQFTEDGCWYRAEVTDNLGDGTVEVMYVDYGNTEKLTMSSLLALPGRFCKLPCQAVHCQFSNIFLSTSETNELTPEAGQALQELLMNKSVVLVIDGHEQNGIAPVRVIDTSSSEDVDLAEVLVTQGLAVHGGNHQAEDSDWTAYNMSDTVMPDRGDWAQSIPRCLSPLPSTSRLQPLTAVVSHVVSPSCFFIQVKTDELDVLAQLMDELNDHCSDTDAVKSMTWRADDICCAQYSEDHTWYRARVQDDQVGDMVKVFYVDYGNSETISASKLRPLPQAMAELPCQALQCHLWRVKPIGQAFRETPPVWPAEASDRLAQMVDNRDVNVLLKQPTTGTSKTSVPVDILIHLQDDGTAPQSVSNLLAHDRLAGFVSLMGPFSPVQSTVQSVTSQSALTSRKHDNTHSSHSHVDRSVGEAEYHPHPIPTEPFIFKVTLVDNCGFLYGYQVEERGGHNASLKLMERALQRNMAGKKRFSLFEHRFAGEAGCVLCRDEKWRRCRIDRLLAGDELEVCLVDSGFKEVVHVLCFQPEVFRADLPCQVLKCFLHDFPPAVEGSVWPAETVQLLSDLALDKLCGAKVFGSPIYGRPIPIGLQQPSGVNVSKVMTLRCASLSRCNTEEKEMTVSSSTDESETSGRAEGTNSDHITEERHPCLPDDTKTSPQRAEGKDGDLLLVDTSQITGLRDDIPPRKGTLQVSKLKDSPLPPVGTSLLVTVVGTDKHPNELYIQIWTNYQQPPDLNSVELTKRVTAINTELNRRQLQPLQIAPQPGQVVAAPYHDGKVYRADVLQVVATHVSIRYSDFGGRQFDCLWESLFELPEEMCNVPRHVCPIRIVDMRQPSSVQDDILVDDAGWPMACLGQVVEFVEGKFLIAEVQGTSLPLEVTLVEQQSGLSLSAMLAQKGLVDYTPYNVSIAASLSPAVAGGGSEMLEPPSTIQHLPVDGTPVLTQPPSNVGPELFTEAQAAEKPMKEEVTCTSEEKLQSLPTLQQVVVDKPPVFTQPATDVDSEPFVITQAAMDDKPVKEVDCLLPEKLTVVNSPPATNLSSQDTEVVEEETVGMEEDTAVVEEETAGMEEDIVVVEETTLSRDDATVNRFKQDYQLSDVAEVSDEVVRTTPEVDTTSASAQWSEISDDVSKLVAMTDDSSEQIDVEHLEISHMNSSAEETVGDAVECQDKVGSSSLQQKTNHPVESKTACDTDLSQSGSSELSLALDLGVASQGESQTHDEQTVRTQPESSV